MSPIYMCLSPHCRWIRTNSIFLLAQGGVKTILSGFYNILSQTDPSLTGLLFLLAYFYPISSHVFFLQSHMSNILCFSLLCLLLGFMESLSLNHYVFSQTKENNTPLYIFTASSIFRFPKKKLKI